jgi:hypothetical protein
MGKVVEDEERRELRWIARHGSRMPRRELGHGPQWHRADMVDVQLSLGKTGDEAF